MRKGMCKTILENFKHSYKNKPSLIEIWSFLTLCFRFLHSRGVISSISSGGSQFEVKETHELEQYLFQIPGHTVYQQFGTVRHSRTRSPTCTAGHWARRCPGRKYWRSHCNTLWNHTLDKHSFCMECPPLISTREKEKENHVLRMTTLSYLPKRIFK